MKRRDNDKAEACNRTSRMFRQESGWYFKTREGDTVGPFCEELEASTQLEVHIRLAAAGLLPEAEQVPVPQVAKKRVG